MKPVYRYLIILIAVMVLWNTIVIKPLKIFTVFLHELGHALMAYIFGYGIQSFKVFSNESGYTVAGSKGWFSSFMIANGGYLGSILFAVLIIYLSRTAAKKYILGGISLIFIFVSLRFSGLTSFTMLYSVIFAVVVIILYMIHNDRINSIVIDIIGVSAIAYAVYDTFVDTILLRLNGMIGLIGGWNAKTDAMQLAQLTGIPDVIWGIIWLVISILAVKKIIIDKPAGTRRK